MIIRFKIFVQKLCQSKYDWDDVVPEKVRAEWNELTADLNQTLLISLPRSYFSDDVKLSISATLCGFCDASTKAYAAVVYLLLKTETHKTVRFVAAKTGVAP